MKTGNKARKSGGLLFPSNQAINISFKQKEMTSYEISELVS